MVYCAVVMAVLLYGAESWVNKRAVTRKLESFNNKCLRRILGITKAQQRTGRITSAEVRRRFGVEEMLEDVVAAKRLRWAGHVARMKDCRLPKRLMFGWLPQKRPAHGTKQRWRDRVRKDLKQFRIEESSWFQVAQDRDQWRAVCTEGLTTCTEERQKKETNTCGPLAVASTSGPAAPPLVCPTCSRSFRRKQDIARHKCQTTRPQSSRLNQPNAV